MTTLPATSVYIQGSSAVFGSRVISSEEVDRAFGMPEGKLRHRAGIESLAYAAGGEQEIHLANKAATEAMRATGCAAAEIDWIVATSETHRAYPSLAAQLHSRLGLREDCGALDVGGACLGFVNALQAASSFLKSEQGPTALVVTADVHSRILVPGRVPGEFGGLFGDGACAFLLRRAAGSAARSCYRLGGLFFGCADQYSEAIRLDEAADGKIDLIFDGEGLSRAAITKLQKVIAEIESRSGIARNVVRALATHQPNPRLLALLAKQLGVPADRFPSIAQTRGNLGSSTCAAALHAAISRGASEPASSPEPVFLASLGPGLLMGGGWLVRGQKD